MQEAAGLALRYVTSVEKEACTLGCSESGCSKYAVFFTRSFVWYKELSVKDIDTMFYTTRGDE